MTLLSSAGNLFTAFVSAITNLTIDDDDDDDDESMADYHPTPADVVVVKVMMEKSMRLPPELMHVIIDHAEYWPHATSTTNFHENQIGRFTVMGGGRRGNEENKLLLRCSPIGLYEAPTDDIMCYSRRRLAPCLPLTREYGPEHFEKWMGGIPHPSLEHPVRKIVFTLESNDQGWGGEARNHGTYRHSWTWFDVGLEKFDADNQCPWDCPDREPGHPHGTQGPLTSPAEQRPAKSDEDSSEKAVPHSQLVQPICSLRPIYPEIRQKPAGGFQYYHGLLPGPRMLQRNVLATRKRTVHVVTWSWTDNADPEVDGDKLEEVGRGRFTGNGEFVRNLKVGDVVTVWGCARFAAWANQVRCVKVDIYWAI